MWTTHFFFSSRMKFMFGHHETIAKWINSFIFHFNLKLCGIIL
ncbi:Uncharacterized protein APZ42_003931 [Daphnia magna]|uniref:Uncharacterized protein n=1 Tax=Daphnia magna TaxID=35525 RepID=A0A164HCI9_9CRUS|nr:Uncharacterized protein APZ42_003931 [Daphnia magna]